MKVYHYPGGRTVRAGASGLLRALALLGALLLAAALCLVLTGCGAAPDEGGADVQADGGGLDGTGGYEAGEVGSSEIGANPGEQYAVTLPEGVLAAGDPASADVYWIALCGDAEDPLTEDIAARFQSRLDEIGRERHAVFALSVEYSGQDADVDTGAGPWTAIPFTTLHGAASQAVSRLPDGRADLLAGIGTLSAIAMRDMTDRMERSTPKAADTSSESAPDMAASGEDAAAGHPEDVAASAEEPSAEPAEGALESSDSAALESTEGASSDSAPNDADSVQSGADSAQNDEDGLQRDADSAQNDGGARAESGGLPVIFTGWQNPVSPAADMVSAAEFVKAVEELYAADNVSGLTVSWDGDKLVNLLMALEPDARKVGVLYNPQDTASAAAVSDAVALFQAHGVELVERTGSTPDELQLAAQALVEDAVDAVYTPDDSTVLAAEEIVGGVLAEAGIPHYAASTAFAKAGAFLGYGPEPTALGRGLADLAAAILLDGDAAGKIETVEPSAAVNGRICAALGRDSAAVLGTLEPLVPALALPET